MKTLQKFLQKLESLMEIIGMLLLIAMVVVIGGQIFCRYVFNFTPKWSEDVALIFMVWFSFLGMAIGVKRGIHLSIEYFVNNLNPSMKSTVEKLDNFLVMIFGIILAWNGYELSEMAFYTIIPSIDLPMTVIYAVTPIAGLFIAIFSLLKIIVPQTMIEKEEIVGEVI
jgi:TRAP-type C4-dicarboxylate transport system permease small subunit